MKFSNGLSEKEGRMLSSHTARISDCHTATLTPRQALEEYGVKIPEKISGVQFGLQGNEYYCPWFMANTEEIQELLKITGARTIIELNGKSVEIRMHPDFSIRGIRLSL